MEIVSATKLTIFASVILAGINIHHLWERFQNIKDQLNEVYEMVQSQEVSEKYLSRMNLSVSLITPISFSVLLYWSGLSWWILGLALTKSLLGSLLSLYVQKQAMQGQFSQKTYYTLKVDAALNLFLITGLIWILFQ